MDSETVSAIEQRRFEIGLSVFNMGTLDEKVEHCRRLAQTGFTAIHLDEHGDETYSLDEVRRFTMGFPIDIHNLVHPDVRPMPTKEELAVLKGHDVRAYMFHPTLVDDSKEPTLREDSREFADRVQSVGIKAFAVVDHESPLELLWAGSYLYDPNIFDGITVMTVKYGQSGQGYTPAVEDFIAQVRKRMHPQQKLWVDGGIRDTTIPLHQGIDGVVSASYLLKAEDPKLASQRLQPEIVIASDHAGYDLKNNLVAYLRAEGVRVWDLGCYEEVSEPATDYPHYAAAVADAVSNSIDLVDAEGLSSDEALKGILVCGSGIGMSITANKFDGIRAALVQDARTARLAKEHNDANVLCLGQRYITPDQAYAAVDAWRDASHEEERHQRRVGKISEIEAGI